MHSSCLARRAPAARKVHGGGRQQVCEGQGPVRRKVGLRAGKAERYRHRIQFREVDHIHGKEVAAGGEVRHRLSS